MGIEDRDWFREGASSRRARAEDRGDPRSPVLRPRDQRFVIGGIAAALILGGLVYLSQGGRRAAAPADPTPIVEFPVTGMVGRARPLVGPVSTLHVEAPTSGADNYVVRLYDIPTNNPVQTVYVRAGDQVDVHVPVGAYTIRFASGHDWRGVNHLFGSTGKVWEADAPMTFTTMTKGSITLEAAGDGGGNFRGQTVSPSRF